MIRGLLKTINRIFYIAALILFAATCIAAFWDCAKSVAFAKLTITPISSFLMSFGLFPPYNGFIAESFYSLCLYTPIWVVSLFFALLFYYLATAKLLTFQFGRRYF